MRKDLSEPQQWRSRTRKGVAESGSWVSRRQFAAQGADRGDSLPVEAVDAFFADESIDVEAVRGSRRDMVSHESTGWAVAERKESSESDDLLQSLSAQLAMLKTQQEHLQKLLDQAQGS